MHPRTFLVSVLIVGATACTAGAVTLNDGLVGYYPFTGNANDASGNGNDGVVSGAQPAPDRFGHPDRAYAFTAASQYITTSGSTGFPVGTADFSVSLWMNLSELNADHQILFCNGGVNQFQLDVFPSASSTAPMEFNTGGDYPVSGDVHTSDVTWQLGQWYNLQVVRSLNTISVYRDGSMIGQGVTTQGNDAPSGSQYLRFGHGVAPQEHQFFGQLDDIRIYDRALGSDEIQNLYRLESTEVPDTGSTALMSLPLLGLLLFRKRQ